MTCDIRCINDRTYSIKSFIYNVANSIRQSSSDNIKKKEIIFLVKEIHIANENLYIIFATCIFERFDVEYTTYSTKSQKWTLF